MKQQSQNNLLTDDIDIHQKRVFLEDPQDPHTHLLANILVYSSLYYPHTKSLIRQAIFKIVPDHSQKLLASVSHLYGCLEREVIIGPSSSYIPPAQLPHLQRADSSLLAHPKEIINNLEGFISSITQLNLKDLFPLQKVPQLSWYSCSRLLSMKSAQNYKASYKLYASQLQIDGQSWLQSTPFSNIFCFLQHILTIITEQTSIQPQINLKFKLISARLAYLHNKILQSPVKRLSDVALKNYREILSQSNKNIAFEDYIELLLEYSFCLLFYYKYSQSEAALYHCFSLLKIKKQFTGKLGRRTKYQQFDTPQLVMNLKQQQQQQQDKYVVEQQEQSQSIKLIDAKILVARERGLSNVNQADKIKRSTYDEESILLQTPKFVQQVQKGEQTTDVSAQHLLVTLASIYYEWRSTPHDQMLYQHISASIMALLKYQIPTSFSYNFSILLLRSLNQFPRIKHAERALDQLEKLKALFNNRANKNTHDLYSTPYETHLGYILILADKYMEIGLTMTAVQLFEQAQLYEECIDALVRKNYKQKALELLNKLVSSQGHNARTLCMLGDINGNEIKSYEEAWKISKGTCARAQRSLGWYYFGKNQFQLAAESFVKATQASYYHPNTWFTLGCTYMRLNQFDKALKAFSETISIDDTQGEAWGNMASCYMYQKKMKEAYSTLQQAVRYSEGNWKLWANLLSVSLSLKKFYKYFDCIQNLVKLGQQQILNEDIFKKVVQVIKFKLQEKQERRRILYNYRNRIQRLFVNLSKQIGQNPLVWKSRAEYQITLLDYLRVLKDHYHNLYEQNKVDPNDLIPGYQNLQSVTETTCNQTNQAKRLAVEYKQYELNMTMRVGWHQNKVESSKVKNVLLEYVQIYRNYSQKLDKADFKIFVNGVSQKIAYCLQEKFSVELDWL